MITPPSTAPRPEGSGGWPVWLRFALLSVTLLSLAVWLEPFMGPLNRATAFLAGRVLELWGQAPLVQGELITLSGFTVRIIGECTSLYATLLLASFILATPATGRQRLAGIAAGGAVIGVVNLLRVVVVTIVGATRPELFEMLHVFLGQVLMLLMVVGCCLVWNDFLEGKKAAGSGFVPRCLAWATLLFFPWLMLNVAYMRVLDVVVQFLFALAGHQLVIPHRHALYYQTFNLVLLGALMLAERRFAPSRRLIWLALGVAILVTGHIMFRIGNVMLTAFGQDSFLTVTGVLSAIGGYFLPAGVWLAALRPAVPCREARQ